MKALRLALAFLLAMSVSAEAADKLRVGKGVPFAWTFIGVDIGQMIGVWEAAGIEVVAISTETPERLREGLAKHSPNGDFPIRLLPDPELQAFHANRAFDDFENQPLHGTFLIDGQGLVRWQDIGFEPFGDVDFLLKESQRLLHQSLELPPAQAAAPAAVR